MFIEDLQPFDDKGYNLKKSKMINRKKNITICHSKNNTRVDNLPGISNYRAANIS